jgi:ABC-type sugar transport system ATPase subunit
MRGIRKSFGPVEVLHGVDFEVLPGEVHVLAGENGAGKSTLIKILSGVYDDFAGEVILDGRSRRFPSPREAVRAGVATIHQELSLVPTMTIVDNLFLGQEITGPLGRVRSEEQEEEAVRLLDELGLECSPLQTVAELPVASQQILEIARALDREARLVIFDEPTSALREHEVGVLFQRILGLRRLGRGIIYITHKMEEIYRLADRITVLRDGSKVGTAPADDLPPAELVRWMVGRELDGRVADRPPPGPSIALEVRDLRVAHPSKGLPGVVRGLSFELRQGEVLGLAGLQGSGASEVLQGLFGALGRRAEGKVRLDGEPFPLENPAESVARGVLLLTNDRKALGMAPEQSVVHSVSMAGLSRFTGILGWMRSAEERDAVKEVTDRLGLAAPSLDAPVKTLSGGNQQKVYLARCLVPGPRVLLLDEPTRGVDVGAKADIYEFIRSWVDQGISIVLITSEMDELLLLSDRILVMHRGRFAAALDRGTASKDAILSAAMGRAADESGVLAV